MHKKFVAVQTRSQHGTVRRGSGSRCFSKNGPAKKGTLMSRGHELKSEPARTLGRQGNLTHLLVSHGYLCPTLITKPMQFPWQMTVEIRSLSFKLEGYRLERAGLISTVPSWPSSQPPSNQIVFISIISAYRQCRLPTVRAA